jgi:hypothetical protein
MLTDRWSPQMRKPRQSEQRQCKPQQRKADDLSEDGELARRETIGLHPGREDLIHDLIGSSACIRGFGTAITQHLLPSGEITRSFVTSSFG